jgi:Rad4 beta-hairpin domain 1
VLRACCSPPTLALHALQVSRGGGGALARRMQRAANTLSAQEMRAARCDSSNWQGQRRPTLQRHRVICSPSRQRRMGLGAPKGACWTLNGAAFRCREDAELGERAVVDRAALPTTLEGFKKHPLYVLQRHMPRYSALAPGAKSVGLHR